MTRAVFDRAIARFDAANDQDPSRVTEGTLELAKEVLYARRMSAWLAQLYPGASDELRLAARAQHLCRWRCERSGFPAGRAGYKAWRSAAARMHAELAGEILVDVGYHRETVERVQSLLMKRGRKVDPDAQRLEDVACLVFLEHYFDDFARARDDDALVVIVRKTWAKMSEPAHAAALGLALSPRVQKIVARALES